MLVRHAIWIRTAKTGGTSIEAALLDNLLPCGRIPHFEECPPEGFVFPDGKIICLAPNTIYEIPKFAQLHSTVWTDAFKFGVVRNPYDRFVSGWKYLHSIKNKSLRDVLLDLPATGPEYVHLTLRQVDWLTIEGRLPNIHLLRFERLQQDLDDLCDILGIERRVLPFLNQTVGKDKHYLEYYTDETKRLAAEKYREDFELLGYDM